ncbi:MAG: hypothetical protein OES84_05420 [Kiritimatiellaceae bacterium]|nr:hypothetical protein [Kiritimatiellaceae bacterium]
MEQELNNEQSFIFKPSTGTALAVSAGLSFFFLSMILPFVGPAGSKVEHADENQAAFLLVLFVTFILAGLSTWSKIGRRKCDGSPFPLFSLGLCVVCVLTLVVLLAGGFAI